MKLYAIVPVYNVAKYLPDFFKSLEEQDYQNITYVLVDDGSTDESGRLCREQVRKDDRFHLIVQKNSGVSSARNAGLDYVENNSVKGDYTLFFDPDDYLTTRTAIRDIVHEIEECYADIIIYNYTVNNKLTISVVNREALIRGQDIGRVIYPWMCFGKKHDGSILSASLFRSAFAINIIKENNLRFRTDIRKAEDTLFYSKYLTLINNARMTTIAPYNYRVRPESLTTTYRRPNKLGVEKGLSILSEFQNNAEKCKGLSMIECKSYFQYRYILVVLNYIIALTDQRCGYSRAEIKAHISELYANETLKTRLKEIDSLNGANIVSKIQSAIVKKRVGLILYGRAYHLFKKIRNRMNKSC